MRQRGIVALHDSEEANDWTHVRARLTETRLQPERASQKRGYSGLTRVRKARFLRIIRNMVWCVPDQRTFRHAIRTDRKLWSDRRPANGCFGRDERVDRFHVLSALRFAFDFRGLAR